jgi:hypothetical protein
MEISIRVSAKTDLAKLISPTDRTDIGRRNPYHLPVACCRWQRGVSAVTAGGRQVADLHSATLNK